MRYPLRHRARRVRVLRVAYIKGGAASVWGTVACTSGHAFFLGQTGEPASPRRSVDGHCAWKSEIWKFLLASDRQASTLNLIAHREEKVFVCCYSILAQTCSGRFHSVAVITSALHAEGPGFEPQWNHSMEFSFFVDTLRFLFASRNLSFTPGSRRRCRFQPGSALRSEAQARLQRCPRTSATKAAPSWRH